MERRMIVYPGQTSRVTEKALLAPFFCFSFASLYDILNTSAIC